MSVHIGKIGRLPQAIREQINERLTNGEVGKSILAWLNDLPEVQRILATQFGGRPIGEQNLSNWRNGGYLEWLKRREELAHLHELLHPTAPSELPPKPVGRKPGRPDQGKSNLLQIVQAAFKAIEGAIRANGA